MIAAIAIASGLALAQGLPAKPAPPMRLDGECQTVIAIRAGQPLPESVVQGVIPRCHAMLVPPSQYADLLVIEKWGQAIYDSARILEATEDALAKAAQTQVGWYSLQLTSAEEDRDRFRRLLPVGAVGGLVGGAALALAARWVWASIDADQAR